MACNCTDKMISGTEINESPIFNAEWPRGSRADKKEMRRKGNRKKKRKKIGGEMEIKKRKER